MRTHVPQLLLKFLMPAGKSTSFLVLGHTWLKTYLNTVRWYWCAAAKNMLEVQFIRCTFLIQIQDILLQIKKTYTLKVYQTQQQDYIIHNLSWIHSFVPAKLVLYTFLWFCMVLKIPYIIHPTYDTTIISHNINKLDITLCNLALKYMLNMHLIRIW